MTGYWTLGEPLEPSLSPKKDTIDKACYYNWFIKARDTLCVNNVHLKLPGDIRAKLFNDTEEVGFELFGSTCASRDKPSGDTTLTCLALRMSWN